MSSAPIRFDGRVAIVTGAGGGLGRIYALDLAARGCKVVVNDLGVSAKGEKASNSSSSADKVVAEIVSKGGKAVADGHSVAEGEKIVQTALKAFGRVDILINNAGIIRDSSFGKMSEKDWDLVIETHLKGTFSVTKAVWGLFLKNNYGRIVNVTSSSGLYGNFGQANYATAKMGLVGFTKTLSKEGEKHNILVNVIAPTAASRMTETIWPEQLMNSIKPEQVSPFVLWLCSEGLSSTGDIFEVGGGFAGKLRWQRTKGKKISLEKLSPEEIRSNFQQICSFENGVTYPESGKDAIEAALGQPGEEKSSSSSSSTAPSSSDSSSSSPASTASTSLSLRAAAAPSSQAKSKGKPVVSDILNSSFPPTSFSFSERDALLYAVGIGFSSDPLDKFDQQFSYENSADFATFPLFGVLFPFAAAKYLFQLPNFSFPPAAVLHAETYLEFKKRKALPTSGSFRNSSRICDLAEKERGTFLVQETETRNEKDEVVLINRMTSFVKGLTDFGAPKSLKVKGADEKVPSDSPPTVVFRERIPASQAFLYRLSGDYNPLHVDPEAARTVGFSRPILHGLCTLGFATRAVLKTFCPAEVDRFKSINVRFSKSVYPGEVLITEMWKVGDNKIAFRAKIAERAEYVLENGVVELFPATKASPALSSAISKL